VYCKCDNADCVFSGADDRRLPLNDAIGDAIGDTVGRCAAAGRLAVANRQQPFG
jgi:hypothetical protein